MLQQLENLGLGTGAHRTVGDLAVFHHHEGGDAHDAETAGQLGVFVHINLAHPDVGSLVGDLLNEGADHPAGAAPAGPEVQKHRFVGVEDKFGKSGKVPVLLEEYGLTAANIAAKAKAAVALKK